MRVAISLSGLLAVAALHFWAGRELSAWIPAQVGRAMSMVGVVAAPALLGTALIVFVSQPMAGTTTGARIVESAFWLFAAAGAFLTKPDSRARRASRPVGRVDGAAMLIAVLAVRLLARGVPSRPS